MGLLDHLTHGKSGLDDMLGALGGDSGLGEIVGKLEQGGLSEIVSSWTAIGGNLPVSPDQLEDALGGGALADLAAKFGINSIDPAPMLSRLLPDVIDRLTPEGKLPSMIGGLVGRFS